MESYEVEWCFLNLNLHTNHLGILLHVTALSTGFSRYQHWRRSFSTGSSQSREQAWVFWLAGRFLLSEPPGEPALGLAWVGFLHFSQVPRACSRRRPDRILE